MWRFFLGSEDPYGIASFTHCLFYTKFYRRFRCRLNNQMHIFAGHNFIWDTEYLTQSRIMGMLNMCNQPQSEDHWIQNHKTGCQSDVCVDGERTFLWDSQTGNLHDVHILSDHAFSYEECKSLLMCNYLIHILVLFYHSDYRSLAKHLQEKKIQFTLCDT